MCDELDAHLRQRVQELMLCGMSEAAATAEAIEELGDAENWRTGIHRRTHTHEGDASCRSECSGSQGRRW